MKALMILALAAMSMMACKNNADDAARESLATPATTATQPTQTPAAAPAAVPVGPLTSISYPETEFDFGEIEDGEKVTHEFSFKNTGNEPLVISKAQGSVSYTHLTLPTTPYV